MQLIKVVQTVNRKPLKDEKDGTFIKYQYISLSS